MVFGFFSRKTAAPAEEAGSSSSSSPPLQQFQFPPKQQQLHTPAPSIDDPTHKRLDLPPDGPAETPTPPPDDDDPLDPTALHALIASVPAQTLHAYTLAHLSPVPPSPFPFPQALPSGLILHKPPPPLSPKTISVLSAFFSSLTPPPKLHCVRCHNGYFELENTDRSCHIAHDDDSAVVDRVRTGLGLEYETLWGCCGRTTEGDGDQGPPDGWCYEGMHTTDTKRARFRADSTVHQDMLTSCIELRCNQPPLPPRSTRTRKRSRRAMEVDGDDADAHSVASSSRHSRGQSRGRGGRGHKRNASAASSKGKARADPDAEDDEDAEGEDDEDELPPARPAKRARARKASVVLRREDTEMAMDVDVDAEGDDDDDDAPKSMTQSPPHSKAHPSPPKSPRRAPAKAKASPSAATATARPKPKPKAKPRPIPSSPHKPASLGKKSPLSASFVTSSSLDDTFSTPSTPPPSSRLGVMLPPDSPSPSASRRRAEVEVAVGVVSSSSGRKASSASLGRKSAPSGDASLVRKGSVASLASRIENGTGTGTGKPSKATQKVQSRIVAATKAKEKATAKANAKAKALGEVVDTSVDGEMEMV